ncbi:solute carrier family 23 member 1-like [Clavelina lepadiformis]|uniref:solute carrier family 23 member 1-like n=1 Tax=Clavelina lepadiformis TaxID=159417 RepID=UPI0040423ECA
MDENVIDVEATLKPQSARESSTEEGSGTNHVIISTSENSSFDNEDKKLLYGLEDVPPWYMCILLGFQHYLTMFGSTVAVPLILAGPLGIENDNLAKGQIISTIFFASGICTLLQTTLGNRLPIVQGAAFSFLTPAIAIMTSIPNPPISVGNSTNGTTSPNVQSDFWKVRMLQVQGAIMVASCTQVLLGATGLIGFMMAHIGPLTIAPTVAMVGLSLYGPAGDFAGRHWGISVLTMFLIILFSQHLRNVEIPIPLCCKKGERGALKIKLFSLFPVIFAVLLAWSFCAILTAAGAFPSDRNVYGYLARTDIRLGVLNQSPWFRVPYPGQWGVPVVTLSGVLGMISGVLASIIESVGDYYACARLCYIPSPPSHAMNRGIFTEGIGTLIAGSLGSGNGTTSYSENIGAIGITKVGSRRVIQTGACIMLILAVIGKFGALFTTIPDPVVGGLFCVMFGMITAVGISSLQFVDLNSSRNLLIMGFSTFMGITVPNWISANKNLISTGSVEGDQILFVLLQTGMFISGVLGFILDNTIPGTLEERGLIRWRATKLASDGDHENDQNKFYEFPRLMQKGIDKVNFFKYIPVCTTFHGRYVANLVKRVHSQNETKAGPESIAMEKSL